MAVIQLNSYVDFKMLAAKGSPTTVYYWMAPQQPSWMVYTLVAGDWFWYFFDGARLPNSLSAFQTDFPKAVQLQGGLTFSG